MFAVGLAGGCAVSRKVTVKPTQVPVALQSASKAELVAQYNELANQIKSLNASVTMQFTSGSEYTGVVEQYHEISGFVLAQKPANIRVIGQVPVVGKNIFDMESDGQMFHIFIPSKNQFLVGPANLERPSTKPIENLRPQHLIDAIFWMPIPEGMPVLLDQVQEQGASYYVLIVARSAGASKVGWELARKIWFDRKDLSMARIETYDNGDGAVSADILYKNWDMFGAAKYPRSISLSRPGSAYQLQIGVTKLTVDEEISPDRFELNQPDGTQLVQVGEQNQEPKP
jgi:outer membrane lipoprotein-sorting protein